ATESFIKQNGYLGRSWGCPALPPELARDIIDLIKDGSVIYATA
ncbi:murein L,D-transpeptidase catalytic domain-containing protein, partial [Vibrio campbellii]